MKKGYLKYSDERNKRFSIKTEIDIQKKEVRKFPIYVEGNVHMDSIYVAQEYLKKYYSRVEVCKAWKKDNYIAFEFVEGESLMDKYNQCLQEQNIKQYEELLLFHRDIICGDSENACTFEGGTEFQEWFGDDKAYIGLPALKYSNFDAIASNIIIREKTPVFIDYEWTMSFQMPRDLVVYHCVHDAYLHNSQFEEFYPIKKVLELLDINTDLNCLEESYKYFFDYVICDENGNSYAKDKYTCLKNIQTIEFILNEWEKCAENWKNAAKANANLEKELTDARIEWEKCADNWKNAVEANAKYAENWKNAVEANENLKKEIADIRVEWEKCATNWKDAVAANENLQNSYNDLEIKYNDVINSKVWQMNLKVRKIVGK